METMEMHPIAHMRSDFPTKFGIPRQSGLVEELRSMIVFEPEYRSEDALRGIEDFSHLWLIWQFSQAVREGWSPTVRPPRLGGNTRMGVFATRSPFRPNNLGLSCVRLLEVKHTQQYGTVLIVGGADLLDGTPIFDIKPYIPYSDSRPEAAGGFTDRVGDFLLDVEFPQELLEKLQAQGVNLAYVTLHVGLGTFRPVKAEEITDHHMHSEFCMMSAETAELLNRTHREGHRIVCVGTTSCRTVESLVEPDGTFREKSAWTDIFIYPGYKFRALDALITNFHLPESTLVMLVSALAGRENILHAYQVAVQEKYRFFSFGDAMFIH